MASESRVRIQKGPKAYEIIQQENGAADIHLSGTYLKKGTFDPVGSKTFRVFARVLWEDSFQPVIPWTEGKANENGTFELTLPRIPAGGLYTVETCLVEDRTISFDWAAAGDRIRHVGVGDVFAIAGQSNAVGFGKEPVYDPPERGVHALMADGAWGMAAHPLSDNTGTLHPQNADGANPGVSPYLSFAKQLKRILGYPIGLVPSAIGGVPLASWNPDEDGIFYRTLMEILQRGNVSLKGILWYQGCTDTERPEQAETYFDRFLNMVNHFRADLKNPKLPFLTVQINRATDEGTRPRGRQWSKIREAQRQAARKIPDVYIVPSIDCPLTDQVHNSSAGNVMLGMRLAQCALKNLYGRGEFACAPDLESARYLGENRVELRFSNIAQELWLHYLAADAIPFEVLDEAGQAVSIVSYEEQGEVLTFTLAREIGPGSVVNSFVGSDPWGIPPDDRLTHIPMLAFYEVPVEFPAR